MKGIKLLLIPVILLVIMSSIYSVNYWAGALFWIFLLILPWPILIKYRKNKSEFYEKHKYFIILSLFIVNLLDVISTYYFMAVTGNIFLEINFLQVVLIKIFGFNFIPFFIALIIFTIMLTLLVKITKYHTKLIFAFIIGLKIAVSLMNFQVI